MRLLVCCRTLGIDPGTTLCPDDPARLQSPATKYRSARCYDIGQFEAQGNVQVVRCVGSEEPKKKELGRCSWE